MRTLSFIAAALASSAFLVGCRGNDMTQAEIDSLKNSPKMTKDDWAKVANGMKQGAEAARSKEAEWARSKTPEELAKINADRAAMGRPPIKPD